MAAFPEKLKEKQRVADNLAYLGEWAKTPEANIVKLPNISAPLNQLEECIKELRDKGYDVPLYPREPSSPEEQDVKSRYDALMGSAVSGFIFFCLVRSLLFVQFLTVPTSRVKILALRESDSIHLTSGESCFARREQ